jgi:hypothetical protein
VWASGPVPPEPGLGTAAVGGTDAGGVDVGGAEDGGGEVGGAGFGTYTPASIVWSTPPGSAGAVTGAYPVHNCPVCGGVTFESCAHRVGLVRPPAANGRKRPGQFAGRHARPRQRPAGQRRAAAAERRRMDRAGPVHGHRVDIMIGPHAGGPAGTSGTVRYWIGSDGTRYRVQASVASEPQPVVIDFDTRNTFRSGRYPE